MSRLGAAFRNAVGVTITDQRRRVPDMPDGYGMPGYGGWSQGMVWNGSVGGAVVTNERAARLSAVYGCWRLISDAISTLPLGTFTRTEGVRTPFPLPQYLTFELPQATKIGYLTQVVLSLLSDGNAFVAVPRNNLGVPLDLLPLDPTKVEVIREDGVIWYVVQGERYDHYDIMHIPGMLFPGALRGVSPIQAAREVIDAALTTQEYGRNFAANMAIPPALIEVPSMGGDPKVEKEKAKRVADVWQETHGGSNAGRIGVLVGGAQLKTIAVTPEDAQWLDSKRFSVSEIARIYGVPPHLIADASNSTSWGSGLAEQNLAFGMFTLQPTTERIEEGHTRLLTTHGLAKVFVKLNLDAKLRSAPKERAETQAIRISNGSLTINESRALEDQPPVPWGDDPPVTGNAEASEAEQLAAMLQKIYLAVGVVISAEEAREILNRDGAGLVGPAPAKAAAPPAPVNGNGQGAPVPASSNGGAAR
jgi:HK97 family phage portal protein